MRLWSLNPSLLDRAGLGALWREGLLALNVLKGKTKGYKNHPQLIRFKICDNPVQAISDYLHIVCDEAESRGYNYDRTKLLTRSNIPNMEEIIISAGQLDFEFNHLKNKVLTRAVKEMGKFYNINEVYEIPIHRMFAVDFCNHQVETWEKI